MNIWRGFCFKEVPKSKFTISFSITYFQNMLSEMFWRLGELGSCFGVLKMVLTLLICETFLKYYEAISIFHQNILWTYIWHQGWWCESWFVYFLGCFILKKLALLFQLELGFVTIKSNTVTCLRKATILEREDATSHFAIIVILCNNCHIL